MQVRAMGTCLAEGVRALVVPSHERAHWVALRKQHLDHHSAHGPDIAYDDAFEAVLEDGVHTVAQLPGPTDMQLSSAPYR
ncbi:hypothetical protein SGFS_089750 [Streptomyces graminofaciens]|uniref:Uncharacterized protein n=1 Tax=Streptomyces graminofaciens TaxID=68212 RepID=A0ABM7FKP0_9ACTN|nr:hypothetical protein SGFS_089750 [Streptomyces graminofaciens]